MNCREEALQRANEEVQRLRGVLSNTQQREQTQLERLLKAEADNQRLREALAEAESRPPASAPAKCVPCAIRALEKQLDTLQSQTDDVQSAIGGIESAISKVQRLEATVRDISEEPRWSQMVL